jgi:mono/diheme cytochrome c family protein
MNTNKSKFGKITGTDSVPLPSPFVSIRVHSWIAFLLLGLMLVGCRKSDMAEQPRYETFKGAPNAFEDGASARPLVAGTVIWHEPRTDELLYQGTIDGKVANVFPFKITHADLVRGRQQFNIYCSVCHGQTGEGNGMIVQRGLTPPPSYHLDRLRNAPVGHFFYVITNGFGAMYSYAERVKVEDRWRIAAYIRALQLSQNADPSKLTDAEKIKADKSDIVPASELDGYSGPRGKVGIDQ